MIRKKNRILVMLTYVRKIKGVDNGRNNGKKE